MRKKARTNNGLDGRKNFLAGNKKPPIDKAPTRGLLFMASVHDHLDTDWRSLGPANQILFRHLWADYKQNPSIVNQSLVDPITPISMTRWKEWVWLHQNVKKII